MVNKIFSSYSNSKNKDSVDQQLIIEIGTRHLACFLKSAGKQSIRDFELFRFDKKSISDFYILYRDISQDSSILTQDNIDTQVFINNETSLFVPTSAFSKESASDYLQLVFGEKSDCNLLVDDLKEEGMYNIYWMQSEWTEILNQHLKNITFKHSYSTIAEQLFQKRSGDFFKVIFYEDQIVIALFAGGKFQFIQTFTYQSAQDVLYYLLSIAQRFNLPADNINIQVSGMIDYKADLYNDLKKYFKRLAVEDFDGAQAQINFGEFQKHYLIPFFNLSR